MHVSQLAARSGASTLALRHCETLGLSFRRQAPGEVEIEMQASDAFCFRPGQLQATAVFAVADFAAMAAAGTLRKPGWANATVDATQKIVAPARGRCLRARGRVVHAAALLTLCAPEVYAVDGERETLCATLLGTARNLNLAS